MTDRSKGEVWVFAEQEEGRLADIAFELLGKGRELADKLGVKLGAVLMKGEEDSRPLLDKDVEKSFNSEGRDSSAPLVERLFAGGADVVHLVEDPVLAQYRGVVYRPVLVDLIKECAPQIVIFGATHMGRDLAPAVASVLRCGLTADCTDLQIGDYTDKKTGEEFKNVLMQIRPAFGGNIIATIVNARNWPQMATVREGVMRPLDASQVKAKGEGERRIVKHPLSASTSSLFSRIPVEVVEIVRRHSSINLKGSRIIVAGGAGVGSKENFKLLHQLADALGGAVGGSRAAVDLGYCEHERQIGQTGVTVRPALFISCGISGAVQHLAGMQDSAKIIAINTDPEAPIFKVAHYGIVGDLNVVIPKLIKAIKGKG